MKARRDRTLGPEGVPTRRATHPPGQEPGHGGAEPARARLARARDGAEIIAIFLAVFCCYVYVLYVSLFCSDLRMCARVRREARREGTQLARPQVKANTNIQIIQQFTTSVLVSLKKFVRPQATCAEALMKLQLGREQARSGRAILYHDNIRYYIICYTNLT